MRVDKSAREGETYTDALECFNHLDSEMKIQFQTLDIRKNNRLTTPTTPFYIISDNSRTYQGCTNSASIDKKILDDKGVFPLLQARTRGISHKSPVMWQALFVEKPETSCRNFSWDNYMYCDISIIHEGIV